MGHAVYVILRKAMLDSPAVLHDVSVYVRVPIWWCDFLTFSDSPRGFSGRLAMTAETFNKLGDVDHNCCADKLLQQYPILNTEGLKGGMRYTDALVDDARLVLRVLHEAVLEGGTVNNYSQVSAVNPTSTGFSLMVKDAISGEELEFKAKQVTNATGAGQYSLRPS